VDTNTLPPGEYLISDPCYVIPRDEWTDFLTDTSMVRDMRKGRIAKTYEWKGYKLFVSNTAHGDGVYHDQFGNEFGVDAGMIGCIPLELVGNFDPRDGCAVEFTEPFTCGYEDEGGVIRIGEHRIPTGDWRGNNG